MIKKDCLYYEKTNDMGATIDWCKFHKDIVLTCDKCEGYTQKDLVHVVRCKDCVYCKRFNDVWYLPKRDELLCTRYVETYHTTENDYCSRGERREDEID